MSRLAKKPLEIPEKVEVTINADKAIVKGEKVSLEVAMHPAVEVKQEEKTLVLTLKDPEHKAMWGTVWANLRNALEGVSKGFKKKLEINGVGYRANVQGKKIVLNLGYSHQVELEAPEGISFDVDKNNIITVSGHDKQVVGQVAAEIREKRKPEPYKGKGIKYVDEHIRRKAGKKAVASE